MVNVLKALSDENRLRVIHLIKEGYWCGCELEVFLEMTQSNLSRHLAKLKAANIIEGDKSAQWVHYRLSDTFLKTYPSLMMDLDRYFKTSEPCQSDVLRSHVYRNKGMSCKDITHDRTEVMKRLKEVSNGDEK